MGKSDKIEERKRLNEPFLKAFDWLMSQRNISQKLMAKRLDVDSSLISAFRNGTKQATDFYQSKLIHDSIQFGREINIDYLSGRSEYMLIENLPKDEEWRLHVSRDNPDYELMEKENEKEKGIDKNDEVNKIIRIYEKEIDDLKLYHQRECDAYQNTIDAQKETILLLKEKIADLTSQLSQYQSAEVLKKYPFSPGVSDKKDQTKNV